MDNYFKCFDRFNGPYEVDLKAGCYSDDDFGFGKIMIESNCTGIFIDGMVAGDMVSFDLEGNHWKAMNVTMPANAKVYEAGTLFGDFKKINGQSFIMQRDAEKTIYIMADSNQRVIIPVRNATL